MAQHQIVALDQTASQLRETTLAYDDATGEILTDQTPTTPESVATKAYVDEQVTSSTAFVKRAGDTMTGALTLSGAPTATLHAATKAYVDGVQSSLQAGIAANTAAIQTLDADTYSKSETDTAFLTKTAAAATYLTPASASATYLAKTGGTMTGPITLPGAPTADLQAATKAYVDANAGGGAELPPDAAGYLLNDGSGGLTWDPGTGGGGAYLPLTGGRLTGNLLVGDPNFSQTTRAGHIVDISGTHVWQVTQATGPSSPVLQLYKGATLTYRVDANGSIWANVASGEYGLRVKRTAPAGYWGFLSGAGGGLFVVPLASNGTTQQLGSLQFLPGASGGLQDILFTPDATTIPANTTPTGQSLLTRDRGDARYLALAGGVISGTNGTLQLGANAGPSLISTRTGYPTVSINSASIGLHINATGSDSVPLRVSDKAGNFALQVGASGDVATTGLLVVGSTIETAAGLYVNKDSAPGMFLRNAAKQTGAFVYYDGGGAAGAFRVYEGFTSTNYTNYAFRYNGPTSSSDVLRRMDGDARYTLKATFAALLDELVAAEVITMSAALALIEIAPEDPPDVDLPA